MRMVEVPVKLEPGEAIQLLRHFLYGEITPDRVDRARRLVAAVDSVAVRLSSPGDGEQSR